jgi:hypothetical protein
MAAAGAATEAAVEGAVAVAAVVVIAVTAAAIVVTAAIAGKWTAFKSLAFSSQQKSQTVLPAMVIKYLCPELSRFNWSKIAAHNQRSSS